MTVRPSALALTPLLLFLALFFGAGLYFTSQGEPMGFYQLRAPVAILPALALAVWLAHRKGVTWDNARALIYDRLLRESDGRPEAEGRGAEGL